MLSFTIIYNPEIILREYDYANSPPSVRSGSRIFVSTRKTVFLSLSALHPSIRSPVGRSISVLTLTLPLCTVLLRSRGSL